MEYQGEIKPCSVPFEYLGTVYEDCMDFGGKDWCKDEDGNFGVCEPLETPQAPMNALQSLMSSSSPPTEEDANSEENEVFDIVSSQIQQLSSPLPSPSQMPVEVTQKEELEASQQPVVMAASTPSTNAENGVSSEPSALTSTIPVNVIVEGSKESPIVINEVASNDPPGNKDWFELYNMGDTTVDLTGWSIRDNDNHTFVIGGDPICRIPFITEILPGGFLKFGEGIQCSFDFGFSQEDKITLLNADGELIDSIKWQTQDTFPTLSIGRYPDGKSDMVILKPTPGSKNEFANPFYLEAIADSEDGLLGQNHTCCQRLQKIGFSSNLPVMIIDTLGQPLFHKFNLTQEQWQIVIDTIDPSGSVLKSPSLLCTCSEYKDYNGWAGVQYRGQSSYKYFEKKGLGIELREEDNTTNRNFPLLGLPRENDWVLNNPENDGTLGMRNVMAFTLARQMGQYASRYRFMELFLIGDGVSEVSMDHYQGIYMLLEKVKRDRNRVAIKERAGNDITGGYIWKHDNNNIDPYDKFFLAPRSNIELIFSYPDLPSNEEVVYSTQFFRDFESALLSEDWLDPENGYRKYIDYNSFIDFLLALEITKNPDGYRGSTYMFKDAQGPLHMGPIWDVNEAFGMCCGYPIEGYDNNGKSDGFSGGSAISPEGFRFLICVDPQRCKEDPKDGVSQWYRRMWSDEQFRLDTYTRWSELRKDLISNKFILSLFNVTTTYLQDAAMRNYERWGRGGEGRLMMGAMYPKNYLKEWQNDIEELSTWLIDHMNWLDRGWKRFSS